MIDHNLPNDLDDIYGPGAEENSCADEETFAQTEARELLRLIVDDISDTELDQMEGHHCEAWLHELGYEWDESSNGWLIV
jgi:hypothetical protein